MGRGNFQPRWHLKPSSASVRGFIVMLPCIDGLHHLLASPLDVADIEIENGLTTHKQFI